MRFMSVLVALLFMVLAFIGGILADRNCPFVHGLFDGCPSLHSHGGCCCGANCGCCGGCQGHGCACDNCQCCPCCPGHKHQKGGCTEKGCTKETSSVDRFDAIPLYRTEWLNQVLSELEKNPSWKHSVEVVRGQLKEAVDNAPNDEVRYIYRPWLEQALVELASR